MMTHIYHYYYVTFYAKNVQLIRPNTCDTNVHNILKHGTQRGEINNASFQNWQFNGRRSLLITDFCLSVNLYLFFLQESVNRLYVDLASGGLEQTGANWNKLLYVHFQIFLATIMSRPLYSQSAKILTLICKYYKLL